MICLCTLGVGITCRNIPEGHLLQLQQNRPEDTIEMIQVLNVNINIYIYTLRSSLFGGYTHFCIHTYLHIYLMRNLTVGAG